MYCTVYPVLYVRMCTAQSYSDVSAVQVTANHSGVPSSLCEFLQAGCFDEDHVRLVRPGPQRKNFLQHDRYSLKKKKLKCIIATVPYVYSYMWFDVNNAHMSPFDDLIDGVDAGPVLVALKLAVLDKPVQIHTVRSHSCVKKVNAKAYLWLHTMYSKSSLLTKWYSLPVCSHALIGRVVSATANHKKNTAWSLTGFTVQ